MYSVLRFLGRRASVHQMRPRNPIIVIVGATGTGKSQLAVELATRFDGEVINSDAIQLYEGLPIITNKISVQEQRGIPHHLLGSISLNESTWTVGKFVSKATETILDIRNRGKLPILVGGTHYYVQALLFPESILNDEGHDVETSYPILQEPTEVILERLRQVDPIMADRWHPNDRRKIQRSLEIWLQTGKPASEVYAEKLSSPSSSYQAERKEDDNVISNQDAERQLGYDPLIFWVHSSNDVLRPRLDKRVLDMLSNGLLEEVKTLNRHLLREEAEGKSIDKTRGIWVAIGFKEFQAFEAATRSADSSDSEIAKLKADAIERTQGATRQYAKRQLRWIHYKLLSAVARNGSRRTMFLLDSSNLLRWDQDVVESAADITQTLLAGQPLPEPHDLSISAREMLVPRGDDLSHSRSMWHQRVCELCGVTSVTISDWDKHIKSKRHQRAAAAESKRLKDVAVPDS